MILTLIERLRGNPEIVSYDQKAVRFWEELLSREGGRDPDKLADMLGREQVRFELAMGGRWNHRLAQEVLAVAGLARLYQGGTGFHGHRGDLHLVCLAIARSWCSSEVNGNSLERQQP
jgi:hypothetical protein